MPSDEVDEVPDPADRTAAATVASVISRKRRALRRHLERAEKLRKELRDLGASPDQQEDDQ